MGPDGSTMRLAPEVKVSAAAMMVDLSESDGEDDRHVERPRDGGPVVSDPAAATEEECALHARDCTPHRR
ncbi:hypothetical protein GS4_05_03370 [Gordonia soli NBRC 108243]|uniref:Uncharacterized protein n=1 Tax=Gordonia soli NBRC 108243 TaxID=1223545 RepID=M0QEU7_9ACTN|nr:hypothetical protein GS4_05_03370 [Gordonia soli NBRC 108243]